MTTDPKPMAEEERAAILWAKDEAANLDMCCGISDLDDLCSNCRHIFWGAVRGFHAGVEYARPKWISVEERLPEENRLLLVCASSIEPTYGWLCGCGCGKWAINDEPNYSRQKIDHVSFVEFWMPLPLEPKEANDKRRETNDSRGSLRRTKRNS